MEKMTWMKKRREKQIFYYANLNLEVFCFTKRTFDVGSVRGSLLKVKNKLMAMKSKQEKHDKSIIGVCTTCKL